MRVKVGKVARRLLAIARVLEGPSRKVAAESCGMDRQTLRDWVHRCNDKGVGRLSNRGGGGVKPRLTPDQMAQLSTWVEAEFGVSLHERTVGSYLARPGFRRLSVRPEHPNADPET